MPPQEKRIYSRVEVRWPVSVFKEEITIQGETRDMSLQGAFIVCGKPLRPDDRVILTITTPSGPMQVIAQVVRTVVPADSEGKTNGMGVRFIWSSL
jgi:hypothetical protein